MRKISEIYLGLSACLAKARSVSFGQYGEDVLLSTSLGPTSRGRYVDAGAYHPWRGSNTYKLYLRGWSGLTIEPNPGVAGAFRRYRPRDTHVVCGIAEAPSDLRYHSFADGKLNTFSDEAVAALARRGIAATSTQTIPCRPLGEVIAEAGLEGAVDLLSVDCEGLDLEVLRSLDFSRTRPTAILVEDFEGFSARMQGRGPSQIEEFLRARDYAPVGQGMFSTLYVDLPARRRADSSAFRLADVQF